jgi:hypothetical protein
LKSFLLWVKDRILLPVATVLLALGAIVLVAFGLKGMNVGGLLGKLIEGKDPSPPPNPNRDVEPGVPDDIGHTEAEPLPLEREGGQIQDPDTGKPIVLPKGVEPDQVKEVIVVTPTVTEVKAVDTSKKPISLADLDKLQDKIGKK